MSWYKYYILIHNIYSKISIKPCDKDGHITSTAISVSHHTVTLGSYLHITLILPPPEIMIPPLKHPNTDHHQYLYTKRNDKLVNFED